MKKLVTVSLVVFGILYVAIIAGGFAQHLATRERADNNTTTTPVVDTKSLGQLTLDANEVSKHASAGSCWIIIESKVYDITSYFGSHPGGNYYLQEYCGKNATTAFEVSPHVHSSYAVGLLTKYFIGNVGETINSTSSTSTPNLPPPTVTSTPTITTPTAKATYTATDIGKHNSSSSCWFIISGSVYDITSYFGSHPGGNSYLAAYCGADATTGFYGSVHKHTSYAASLLSKYYIGTVGTATTGSGAVITQPIGTSAPTIVPAARSRRENDD